MNDEELERLLRAVGRAAGPPGGLSPDLVGRVRRRYDGRQRWRSRAALLGTLMVGYLIGAGTTWVMPERGTPPVDTGRIAVDESLRRDASSPRRSTGLAVSDSSRPVDRQPVTLPESEYERMQRLGDRYLRSRGEVVMALEFYKRALEAASNEERTVSEEDSWLLRALKEDWYLSRRELPNGAPI